MKKVITGVAVVVLGLLAYSGTVLLKGKSKPLTPVKKLAIASSLNADEWAKQALASLSTKEKIAQCFMINISSNDPKSVEDGLRLIREQQVGGVIFFQGELSNLKEAIKSTQAQAKLPLFIAMDAEWGTNMRLFDGERFPYALTLGAANDTAITRKIGSLMAEECRRIGINFNFAPVADVNSNAANPVIGFRSFGEDQKLVTTHALTLAKSLEGNGVVSCLKHFPGHGNTSQDSHLELPTLDVDLNTLTQKDLFPFQAGINEELSSFMIGHLNVPALDPSKTPASLSKLIIHDFLQQKMKFKGLVVSDALNMEAITENYGKVEAAVKSFEAGCDILLMPEDVPGAIEAIHEKVGNGTISMQDLNNRCLKILKSKHKFIVKQQPNQSFTEQEKEFIKHQTFEKACTVLKNDGEGLQLQRLDQKPAFVALGLHTGHLQEAVDLFADVDYYHYYTAKEGLEDFNEKINQHETVVVSLHASSLRAKNKYSFGEDIKAFLQKIKAKQVTLLLMGSPYALSEFGDLSHIHGIVVAYENNRYADLAAIQLLFGASESYGKLPVSIPGEYALGSGIHIERTGRLKFSFPQAHGIDPKKLKEIDEIALDGIKKGAYPGCQIVVALHGDIIYRKAFGTHTYESKDSVQPTDLYDIASISKIAGSTTGIMRLQTQGKFNLDKKLGDYLPELTKPFPNFNAMVIREMMTHQAGLTPWIAFYKKTLKDGKPNPKIYATKQDNEHNLEVAHDLWMRDTYVDTMYRTIMSSTLGAKKYEYSDLGYYFIKRIIEKQSGRTFAEFLAQEIYTPMGLRTVSYQPLKHFPSIRIVPTENDQAFRKQLIHGFVHDPGAAMLGGVGGHAGCFSNATDLASLFQLFLNKGSYGGVNYIAPEVIEEYTKAQFSGNRRGVGFDRPNASGGGTCDESASQLSYGHSGFTGTLAWADPKTGINYVFLSNRVCPDQDNWRLRDMGIRTKVQHVIYDAVSNRKKV